MEKFFKLSENNTTIRIEVLAGITTFFATAYTIMVNPNILSFGDQRVFNGVFFATCIASAFGTLLMALVARIPFAQAPGMGLSAFFAFTAMPALAVLAGNPDMPVAKQYQMTLPLVFISGILFTVISVVGLREKIINGIPLNIKLALAGGIGMFITHLGLQNAGIVVSSPATYVTLLNFSDVANNGHAILGASLTLIGLFIIASLYSRQIKGGILYGIVATTILAFVTGYSKLPESFSFDISAQAKDFMELSFFKLDFVTIFSGGDISVVLGSLTALTLAFFMVNMFDSMGTIFGVATAAGMVDKNGEVKGLKKGLMCDSIGTWSGALLGSSTVTTVVESSAGIGEGGRTGLSSLVTGALFLIALVFAPVMTLIPDVATAPALIFVGCLMIRGLKDVDFGEPTEALPAFLTVVIMPLTYSIANGIAFGLISYCVVKLFAGRYKEIKIPTVVVSLLFILQFVLG